LAGDDAEEELDLLSQDPLVGVKCMVIRGFFANQACTVGCLWVA
jgi:hypothetical protein